MLIAQFSNDIIIVDIRDVIGDVIGAILRIEYSWLDVSRCSIRNECSTEAIHQTVPAPYTEAEGTAVVCAAPDDVTSPLAAVAGQYSSVRHCRGRSRHGGE